MRKVIIPLAADMFYSGKAFLLLKDKTIYYKCLQGCMYTRLGRAGRWDYIGEVYKDIYSFSILGERYEISLEFKS